jgi:response regulator of citrate/malate metabolism
MRLIIANRYMPILNELKLFWSMQTAPTLKGIPFVMINMDDNREIIDDEAKLGVRHYLVKAFNAEIFDTKAHEILLQPVTEILSEQLRFNEHLALYPLFFHGWQSA